VPRPQARAEDRDDDRGDRPDESQVKRGFEIVPAGVALNFVGKNRALVGLGSTSSIQRAATTVTPILPMHRAAILPGATEMINAAQYLAVAEPFRRRRLSPQISPLTTRRPAGFTLSEVSQVLRTGHDRRIHRAFLLQVMPWPVIGKKTDRDLTAIYEYLRAIPSLPNNPNPGPEP